MGDINVEKKYMAQKAKMKKLHEKLKSPESIKTQEIYHKIMGTNTEKYKDKK